MRYKLALAGQMALYPTFWLLTYVVCRARVQRDLNLPDDPKASFVIAANHQSKLDSFVIAGILPPRFWRLLPCRFITANQYLYDNVLFWLLWPLGGFPAYETSREGWGLRQAKHLAEAGQTVCIFPEGQRALRNEVEAKRGVGVLAQLPNVYIIPINIQWKKRQVRVVAGRAYKATGHSAADILSTVYALQ